MQKKTSLLSIVLFILIVAFLIWKPTPNIFSDQVVYKNEKAYFRWIPYTGTVLYTNENNEVEKEVSYKNGDLINITLNMKDLDFSHFESIYFHEGKPYTGIIVYKDDILGKFGEVTYKNGIAHGMSKVRSKRNKFIDIEYFDGYSKEGYNPIGYDKWGYDKQGFNYHGYDKDRYNKQGFNYHGYDREGYNKRGFNNQGYDREGYNKAGYNLNGYDRNGYDIFGIDKNGNNIFGINGSGYYNGKKLYTPDKETEKYLLDQIKKGNIISSENWKMFYNKPRNNYSYVFMLNTKTDSYNLKSKKLKLDYYEFTDVVKFNSFEKYNKKTSATIGYFHHYLVDSITFPRIKKEFNGYPSKLAKSIFTDNEYERVGYSNYSSKVIAYILGEFKSHFDYKDYKLNSDMLFDEYSVKGFSVNPTYIILMIDETIVYSESINN